MRLWRKSFPNQGQIYEFAACVDYLCPPGGSREHSINILSLAMNNKPVLLSELNILQIKYALHTATLNENEQREHKLW